MNTVPLDRLVAERLFHDDQAAGRAETFRAEPSRYEFADGDYLDHETWLRPAFAALGDLSGKRVLDLGCGHGMAAVVLARAGAEVTACDLSPEYVREAAERADANGVSVRCLTADAEALPFADGEFDAVWGHAILHHLDPAATARELKRVLRPGGIAVFAEPWNGNPILRFARRRLPYPGKHRTRDECPLTPVHLAVLRQQFPELKSQGSQLTSMLGRLAQRRLTTLEAFDRLVLRVCPKLESWSRYLVVILRNA